MAWNESHMRSLILLRNYRKRLASDGLTLTSDDHLTETPP